MAGKAGQGTVWHGVAWLAGLLNEPRRSEYAIEIAGVRIAPCDERGQTADMRALAALNQKETR